MWVSPDDRPLDHRGAARRGAGADAIVTLLHDRVDDACSTPRRAAARRRERRRRLRQRRPRAARRHGITVTNTPGVLTDATADLAIALLLAVTRRLGKGERRIRSGEPWAGDRLHARARARGQDARHRRLGADRPGGRPARPRVRDGDHLHDRLAPGDEPGQVELDELLERAHVVSLHCPLTPETRHLIDADALARMRDDAYLVNTARGPVVDEAALADALRDGVIAGAALDVFESEPDVHPDLVGLDNAVLMPHLGSATLETRTAMAELAAENVVAVLAAASRRRRCTRRNSRGCASGGHV